MRCAKGDNGCPYIQKGKDYAWDALTGLCSGCLFDHIVNYLADLSITHEPLEQACDAFVDAGVDALDDVIFRENRKQNPDHKKPAPKCVHASCYDVQGRSYCKSCNAYVGITPLREA